MTDRHGTDGLLAVLNIEITVDTPTHVEAIMPITPNTLQPFGFVHGGATLALLETVASRGAELMCDFDTSLPFGISIDVRHRKSGVVGSVRGVADLEREEGNKQFWHVCAYDDDGDVMSEGTFMTKIVSRERLAQIEKERETGLR